MQTLGSMGEGPSQIGEALGATAASTTLTVAEWDIEPVSGAAAGAAVVAAVAFTLGIVVGTLLT